MGKGFRSLSSACLVVTVLAVGVSSAFAQGAPAQAQQQPQNQPRHEGIGVFLLGGPLFGKLSDVESLDTDRKTGWLFGVGLGGNRPGAVGVEADILYGKRGETEKGTHEDFDMHVVHVPVMARINVGSQSLNGVSGFGVIGPSIDWVFKSTLGGVDISDDTAGFTVGLVVGGGVEITRFIVQGRYMRGLRAIDRTFNVGQSQKIKTEEFAILFGVRFN